MTVQPMDVRGEAQLQPAYGVIEKAVADRRFRGRRWRLVIRGKVVIHAFGKLTTTRRPQ